MDVLEMKKAHLNRKLYSNDQLLQEVKRNLDNLFNVTLYVRGRSMRPFLRNGDTVILVPAITRNMQVGMIVLADTPMGVMLHRIVRIKSGQVLLMGDANVFQQERVRIEKIWGVVAEAYRNDTKLDLYSWWMRVIAYLWYKVRVIRRKLQRINR